ncbi:MAG: rRNA maturation RNase YbeY [Phycisphaerales bacterium]|nr:rRNA maturation RNase YbeY [Phycisphaerales bacterium]
MRSLLDSAKRSLLEQHLQLAFAQLPNSGQVRIRIVDDNEMSEAHIKYSGIEGTTDVLTFDYEASFDGSINNKILDVDLVICYDEASRQANLQQRTIVSELLLYSVHGVLHCLGFDDHDEIEYKRMHHKEDEILTAIGVGPLFYDSNQTNRVQSKELNQ